MVLVENPSSIYSWVGVVYDDIEVVVTQKRLRHLSEVKRYQLNADELFVLTLADLNVPSERSHKSLHSLAARCASVNDCNPERSLALVTMPDKARTSAALGLTDEYAAMEKAFNSVHQALLAAAS